MRSASDARERAADCFSNGVAISQVGFHEIGNDGAGSQFTGGCNLDQSSGIGGAACQHTVRGNLARERWAPNAF